MKRRTKVWLACFLFVATISCTLVIALMRREEPVAINRTAVELPSEAELLSAINPQSVFVRNGEAAVVRTGSGYMVVLPRKTSVEDVEITALWSASGKFGQDATVVFKGRETVDKLLNIRGTNLWFEGGGESGTYVGLEIGDSQTAIVNSGPRDPTTIDANVLDFNAGD